jgi:hypothetical protein
MKSYRMWIGGDWVDAVSGETFATGLKMVAINFDGLSR